MRIMIADDHAIFREGLRLILMEGGDSFVIEEAASGEDLLDQARHSEWDVVILDISFPGRSGLEILRELKALRPRLPVLVLSMHAEEQYAIRALRGGASGYLRKESASDQLLEAIERVAGGGKYITPAVGEALAAEISGEIRSQSHQQLSDREFDVLCLTGKGKTPTEIAAILGLSIKTVSTYRARILEKMDLDNVAQLILYAIQHRLI